MAKTTRTAYQSNAGQRDKTNTDWIVRLAQVQQAASVDAARGLVFEVVGGWWEAALRGAPHQRHWSLRDLDVERATITGSVAAQARQLGADLADLSVAEANGLVGRLYACCLPSDLRAKTGVFYTPAPLVGLLLDRTEEGGHVWTRGKVLDPSCGGGAFLVQVAQRMMRALKSSSPEIACSALNSRIVGWELDPFAAWITQVSLDIATLPVTTKAGRMLSPVTVVRDSLTSFTDGEGRFALVVGNPPFGKVKDNEHIRSVFGRSRFGHPNLYGLFTDLAVRLAAPSGGRIAYLTPGSFLSGHYFKRLRQLLVSECPPVTLDFITSRRDVFDDVLQEVVLSTFQRGRPNGTVRCRSVSVNARGLDVADVGEANVASGEAPWVLPRAPEDHAIVAAMSQMSSRLSDWGYRVSTGPLVWNRHKDRLYDRPAAGRVPVIWAESVKRDGKFSTSGSKRSHKAWFEARPADRAMLVDQPCVLVQRTTAREQHRRLISAALPQSLIKKHGQITVENHLNMVVATTGAPKVPAPALARFLASRIADRAFRCINASVAVSASELESMPLPPANTVLAALAADDPEGALNRLYGVCG